MLFLAFLGCTAHAKVDNPCGEILTQVFPRMGRGVSAKDVARLEIRRCGEEGFLQLVGWARQETKPHLVADTMRTSVVSLLSSGDVTVVETAGASSNVVQVVIFESGRFRVAFEDAFKSYATISTSWKEVRIICRRANGEIVERTFPTGRN